MAFVAKELKRCGETRARAATVDPDGRVPTTEAGSEPSAQEVVECPSRAAGVGLEQFNEEGRRGGGAAGRGSSAGASGAGWS
jgi:hypothetical protein